MLCFKSFSLVLILLSVGACDAFWQVVLDEQPAPQKKHLADKSSSVMLNLKIPTESKGITSKERALECQNKIASQTQFKKITYQENGHLELEIDSNKIFNEASLMQWIITFADDFFGKQNCSWPVIDFVASVDEASFYKGLIRQRDYVLYKQQKISQPEWQRRFEIKKMDTDFSLIVKLKKMRQQALHPEALVVLDALESNEPGRIDLKIIRQHIAIDQGLYHEALIGLEGLLSVQPQNLEILYNVAYVQKKIGRFQDAIVTYLKIIDLIKITPQTVRRFTDDELWQHVVDVYLKNNQWEGAKTSLQELLDQKSLTYKILHSNILRAEGQFVAAKQILTDLIEAGQKNSLVYFNLTLLNLDLKDEKAAQQSFVDLKKIDIEVADELAFLSVFKDQTPKNEAAPLTPIEVEPAQPLF